MLQLCYRLGIGDLNQCCYSQLRILYQIHIVRSARLLVLVQFLVPIHWISFFRQHMHSYQFFIFSSNSSKEWNLISEAFEWYFLIIFCKSSSLKVAISHSVWFIIIIFSVPNNSWDTIRDLKVSSVTIPYVFLIICGRC